VIERPEVRYARNDGVAVAYQMFGEGDLDLVCIPGFVSNLIWNWEVPGIRLMLERFATFARVVILDRRGIGLSDRLSPDDLPSLEVLADDVVAVMDDAGLDRAAVFAWQSGSPIATMLAAAYPDRVTALALFSVDPCPAAKPDWPYGWSEEQWETYLEGVRLGWGTRAWLLEHVAQFAPDQGFDSSLAIAFQLAASPGTAEAVERLDMQTDIRAILPSVHAPTLVMYRTGNDATPIEAQRFVAERIPRAVAVELPGQDDPPYTEDVDRVVDELDRFFTGARHEPAGDRILATVLFTDVVDSTAMLASLGDATWAARLEHLDRISRDEIERLRGRYVDSTGDGMLATFDGPARAVRCAQAITERIRPMGVAIRAGCHTGEVELVGDGVRGLAVHIGARVMAVAGPSEVVVSQTVKDLVAGSGLAFEEAGEHELKGVPDRWRLYRVVA
jgi:class 3 adenylate cyclase